MKKSRLALLAIASVFSSHSIDAAVYNEGDVTLQTSGFEKCDAFGYPYWNIFWGSFPPTRTPFTSLNFSLLTRTSGSANYDVYFKATPPAFNGNSLNPNMCAIVTGNGRWYRIRVFAQGSGGQQEVSFVSIEIRTTVGGQCN